MPPTPPDMRAIRRALIVKLSAIGDVVHALPVSAALGRAFPHLELSWVVERNSFPMVDGNPFLKEVIQLPEDLKSNRLSFNSWKRFIQVRRILHSHEFDLAIDLQGLSKSAIITWASGARYRFGQDWLRETAPLFETRIPRHPGSVHIVDQLLDVARFLGAEVQTVEFPISIPHDEDERARSLLGEGGIDPGRPFIVINPSHGGGGHKGWAVDKFVQFLDDFRTDPGIPVALVGSGADRRLGELILEKSTLQATNLIGKTNLKQLAAILKRCVLHLCGDTGSAHIAAALGTRVVSIFGRSDPDRLAPYGQREWVIHHREQCAPDCRRFHQSMPINRKQKCLVPPPRCLDAVQVSEVASTVRRALTELSIAY